MSGLSPEQQAVMEQMADGFEAFSVLIGALFERLDAGGIMPKEKSLNFLHEMEQSADRPAAKMVYRSCKEFLKTYTH